jgi:hypothetical protein
VKAFRSLVSGEDADLKAAYDHFHKMVEREEGVVRNAVLVVVTEIKSDTRVIQADVREGLVRMERLQLDAKTMHAGLEGSDDSLQSISADTKNALAVAEHVDANVKSVLANTRQTNTYLRGKWMSLPSHICSDYLIQFADQETDQERNCILTWLSPLDFFDKQDATFKKHHRGTGKWLLTSDTFETWAHGEQNSTLWCPGNGTQPVLPVDVQPCNTSANW